MILYHIGIRKPIPQEYMKKDSIFHSDKYGQCGVFLTPDWRPVYRYFPMGKNLKSRLYSFNVSRQIIKEAGGFKRVDHATEIWIPENLWSDIKFLGSRELPRIKKEMKSLRQIEVKTSKVLSKFRFEAAELIAETLRSEGNYPVTPRSVMSIYYRRGSFWGLPSSLREEVRQLQRQAWKSI